jgi:hypothetical protein
LVLQEWLDFQSINYEQFKLHNTHFIVTEKALDDTLQKFENLYLRKTGIPPGYYAYTGYESLLFIYQNLISGNGFVNSLYWGEFLPGFDYRGSQDNKNVPLYKFVGSGLQRVYPLAPN